jgi:EAL domain-containing protein (putative c-di-GMP-specific phosphodiesterase class I)
VNKIIRGEAMYPAYQPIFDLPNNKIAGFEALSRFPDLPLNAPDIWFREAHAIGMGIHLEVRAIELAMSNIQYFHDDTYISMNISPKTITSASIVQLFDSSNALSRIVLEITEHDAVHQYEEIAETLKPYRAQGLKVAVDDAGAGYASFRHILNLRPDYIKLDISLTHSIDSDPARRALAAALVHFSNDTGCDLIAEGVETSEELATLIELGIHKAQGFFLGRPLRLQEFPAHLLKSPSVNMN